MRLTILITCSLVALGFMSTAMKHIANKDFETGLIWSILCQITCVVGLCIERHYRNKDAAKRINKQRTSIDDLYGRSNHED